MRPGPLAQASMRRITAYRQSPLHDRVGHGCRFAPTCSHYADDALQLRAYPLALLLIAWRLLRCTRLTPMGTVDRVGVPRPGRVRRVAAVLGLSALMTLLVAGTASAVSRPLAQGEGSSRMAGGCDGFVGGVPIGTLNADRPLQVHKGQRIVATGLAPTNLRNLPSTLGIRSTTTAKIHLVEKLATTNRTETATGERFQKSVNVDDYLKYGGGVYRIDIVSVAPGAWSCTATFYVELHGSEIAAATAIAVGAIGAVGVVASAGGGDPPQPEDQLPPKPDEGGTYDPGIAPDQLEAIEARKDRARTAAETGGTACLAGILFALIASTGAFAMTVPPPRQGGGRRRVWVRGRPVLGFISGLVMGLGITLALWQYGYYPLTLTSAIVAPVITAILGAARGWRGTAWRVG